MKNIISSKYVNTAILSGDTLEVYPETRRTLLSGRIIIDGKEPPHPTKNSPDYYIPSEHYTSNAIRSARRSRQKIARIIRENYMTDWARRPKWLTLTYQSDVTIERAARDWDCFLKSIMRRWPDCIVIKKLELQKRGTPHYHCIILNAPYLSLRLVIKLWTGIIGGLGGVELKQIKTIRGVVAYCNKYITDYTNKDTGEILVDSRLYRVRCLSISGKYKKPLKLSTARLLKLGVVGKTVYRNDKGYLIIIITKEMRKYIDNNYQFNRYCEIPQSKFKQLSL